MIALSVGLSILSVLVLLLVLLLFSINKLCISLRLDFDDVIEFILYFIIIISLSYSIGKSLGF